VHDHAFDRLVELQIVAQRRILERLQVVVHRRLAVVSAVGDVLQEQIHFFVGNDVADVLRVAAELGEGEADHLVARDRRTAAVAGIDRGVDLDAKPRHREVVGDELDARDDALGDRERRASGREAVGEHRILDARQLARARQRRMRVEKAGIVELQNREIDARRDGHHGRRQLVAGGVGLHLHLRGVEDHVSVGQYALALDDHAGGAHFRGRLLGPGLERIRIAHGREDLDHGVLDGRRLARGMLSGARRQGGAHREHAEAEIGHPREKTHGFHPFPIGRSPRKRAAHYPAAPLHAGIHVHDAVHDGRAARLQRAAGALT
jgi:hypothetical protein